MVEKKEEKPPDTEKLKIVQVVNFLSEVSKNSLDFIQEKIRKLIELWIKNLSETYEPIKNTPYKPISTKTEELSESEYEELRKTITAAINRCLELDLQPGSNASNGILEENGISLSNLNAGKIILKSLEDSLNKGESLKVIAQKLTILHDFPAECGGSGYEGGMSKCPETRVKLINMLTEELKSFVSDAMENKSFAYIFSRIKTMHWDTENVKKLGLDHIPVGNELTKAILCLTHHSVTSVYFLKPDQHVQKSD